MAKKKNKKQKTKKNFINVRLLFILLIMLSFSVFYMPAALLLFFGMLPTLVAYIIDKKPGKNKTFTIGALNFSGCFYYLVHAWNSIQPMETALVYLQNPVTIIVIYTAAAFGYMLNFVATILISSVLRRRSVQKLEKIEKQKKALEDRWGKKVNGERPLDERGFVIENLSGND